MVDLDNPKWKYKYLCNENKCLSKRIETDPEFSDFILFSSCFFQSISEDAEFLILSIKDPHNIQIRETIGYTTEDLIPVFICGTLTFMSSSSYIENSPNTQRKQE